MTSAEFLEEVRKLSREEQVQLAHDLRVEAEGSYENPAAVEVARAIEIGQRLQGVVDRSTVGIPDS